MSLGISGQNVGAAWTPQATSPGQWRIEGFAALLTTKMEATNPSLPFGLDRSIVSDGIVDFSAAFRGSFFAPDNTGDGFPDDGFYTLALEEFIVQIGDTSWDETMPATRVEVQINQGLAIGIDFAITPTLRSHPDLRFRHPTSPGTWEALDERDDENNGTVSGTYTLTDGLIAPPQSIPAISVAGILTLLAALLGVGGLYTRRRR
jgi:hypothetical protein